jgi:hypothetical protein
MKGRLELSEKDVMIAIENYLGDNVFDTELKLTAITTGEADGKQVFLMKYILPNWIEEAQDE